MLLKKQAVIALISGIAIAIIFSAIVTIVLQSSNNRSTYSTIEESKITNKSGITIVVKPAITPYITEYSLPNGTKPNSILVDRDGMVWTVGSLSNKLYRLDPRTNQLQQYQIPKENGGGSMSWSMMQDNEGFIWFAQFGSTPLWRFDPNLHAFNSFHSLMSPFQMKLDTKTNDVWFTTLSGNTIGVVQKVQNIIDPNTEYKISEFPIGNDTLPSGLDIEGNHVWVAEIGKGRIAEFEPIHDNNGTISNIKKIAELPTADRTWFYSPTDILFSNNTTAWITEHGSSTMTKFDSRSQYFTRIPTAQNSFHVASLPFWIKESSDGKGIWFNEHEGGNIGFFDTNKNVLTEYKLQNESDVVFMLNLAVDPQDPDKAWFSEWNADKIGVVNRNIPVPFEISSNTRLLVFDKVVQNDATVDIQIAKVSTNEIRHLLILNTTTTMTPNGELENMTSSLSQSMVDLSQTQSASAKLVLYDKSVQSGNYTLGISAGNGFVTKTIFLKLTVR